VPIDAIAQSWAVLSGAVGPTARGARWTRWTSTSCAPRHCVHPARPPFDRHPDPGYIRGYVPGVRENGGQYTHAAVWTVMAFAALGDWQRAPGRPDADLINPVNHGRSADSVAIGYKVEPYVVAADVYSVARTPGAAAGAGTPARRAGCTGSWTRMP
jgi:cyclic beta-1,2-glucan synthetase